MSGSLSRRTGWPEPRRGMGQSFVAAPKGGRVLTNAIKRFGYPLWEALAAVRIRRDSALDLNDRHIAITPRGTEYDFLLSLLGKKRVGGARVVLQGVGSGEEVVLWHGLKPSVVVGIDLQVKPHAGVCMVRGDLLRLPVRGRTFEVAGSLNTFEHLTDVNGGVTETLRVLKPGGWIVASFGPLYKAFGGDHFSSLRGGLEHGFNHLLLEEAEYEDFVDAMTIEGHDIVDGEPKSGLAYIRDDLFSHLTFDEYKTIFLARLEVKRLRGHVEPTALAFRERFPEKWQLLLGRGHEEKDLLVSTVTLIARKPSTSPGVGS